MNQKQSIKKNVIFLSLEPIIFGIIAIIVSGYVARNIGAVEYGKLVFALAFINFFTLFTNFGFNNYLMNEFSANPENAENEFIAIVGIRLILAFFTYFAGIIFINVLNYPIETKKIFYAAGLIVFPLYMLDSCEGVFKGHERMQYIARVQLLSSLALQFMRFLVVYLGYKAFALAWVRVIVALGGMTVAFYFLYNYFLKLKISFNWELSKKIIAGTIPFAFSTSFLIIYNRVAIILLSYLAGDASVAYYKSAHLFIEKLLIITVAVVGAVYPAVSRLYQKDKDKAVQLYSKAFVYLFMISIPLSVGGFLLSQKIITLIFGAGYLQAVPVARFLFASVPIIYATNIMGNVLMASNQAKIFSYIMTVLCITNIVLNLILIPIYAHVGAAIATLVSQSVNFFILLFVTSKKFGMLSFSNKFLKVIISAILMGIVIIIMGDRNLFLLVLVGSLIYSFLIIIFQTFEKQELLEIKEMIVNKK
jgi:O-antigen/teichoic acid export membrane protein